MNILSPGTPILYYGNEVGMTGQAGTDLNLRANMDWNAAAAQAGQPESILNWCKYLIKARKAYPSLRGGYATLATDLGPSKVLAYVRDAGAERVAVVANLTGLVQTVTLTDLTAHGVAPGAAVGAILGDTKNVGSLNGSKYSVTALPPHAVRVLLVAGGTFQGTIHGDIQ